MKIQDTIDIDEEREISIWTDGNIVGKTITWSDTSQTDTIYTIPLSEIKELFDFLQRYGLIKIESHIEL